RTGEFTPPGMTRRARSNSSSDRVTPLSTRVAPSLFTGANGNGTVSAGSEPARGRGDGTMIQASEAGPRGDVPDAVPRWAKWFVSLFLTAFVVCGVVGIEAWPLTGWRLFSHVRTE